MSATGRELQTHVGNYTFPKGFVWSTATAAYQIEGAAFEEGRSQSVWDQFVRIPGKIADNSTGDVACDSYHLYEKDVELIKELGVKQYRFSISWSRVLPNGTTDSVNQKGVEYYQKLIALLKKHGVEPMVTLYHWDLPVALADRGGWLNPQIVDWFGDYARFCFKTFGDQVTHYVTLNEPWAQVTLGYCKAQHAPGGFEQHCEWAAYLAGHHMILAHATAYHIYDQEFRSTQKGKVGITNVAVFSEPESPSDEQAAQRAFDCQFGWFTYPIFHPDGNYPQSLIDGVAKRSRLENRTVSRLPAFTQRQIDFVKGSADFLGMNYYSSILARELRPNEYTDNRIEMDAGFVRSENKEWKLIGPPTSWLRSYPVGLRKALNHIKNTYGNLTIMITENGCMDTPGEGLEDTTRITYLDEHLKQLSLAINEDKVNVIGYTLWSLMDNFEWSDGYTFRFGIHSVDFEDPERKRTPKKSAQWFKELIARNSVV